MSAGEQDRASVVTEASSAETSVPFDAPASADSIWRVPGWFRRLGVASWLFVGIIVAGSMLVGVIGATSDIVAPVTLAVVLAIVFEPLAARLSSAGLPRSLAAVAVLAGLAVVVFGTIWLVGVTLVDQAGELADDIDRAIAEIEEWLAEGPIDPAVIDRIREAVVETSRALLGGAGRTVVSVFDTAFGFVAGGILGSVVLYYLLKDMPVIVDRLVGVEGERSPRRELIHSIGRQAATNVRRYYRGRTILALVNGGTIAFAAIVLDVPAVVAIAFVNFVGSYIPYIGGFVGGAFAVLLALGDEGVTTALILLGVTLVVNLVLENFLEPALIGDSLQLHPLLVLLATAIGGIVAGMLGLILGAPLTAIVLDVQRQLRAAGFFDE